MYCIKCGVNSSLLTYFCCRRSVTPWITVLSQQGWYITNLLLCAIPWNKAPCTGPCHIWRTVCPLFGCREAHRGQSIRVQWPLFVLVTSGEACCCFSSSEQSSTTSLTSAPNTKAVSAKSISLRTSCSSFIFFFPGCGSETYNCLPYLHYIWLTRVAETLYFWRYEHLLQWEQNRSQATV